MIEGLLCKHGVARRIERDSALVSMAVLFRSEGVTDDEVAEYFFKVGCVVKVNGKLQIQCPLGMLACIGSLNPAESRALRLPVALMPGDEICVELKASGELRYGASLDRPTVVLNLHDTSGVHQMNTYVLKDRHANVVRVFIDSKTWHPSNAGQLSFDAKIEKCSDADHVKICGRTLRNYSEPWLVAALDSFAFVGDASVEMLALLDLDVDLAMFAAAEGVRVEELNN